MKRSLSALVLLISGLVHGGLTRHNEQGLSPTHSYKGTGPSEAISNLNGNLVMTSVAADITASPLGIRLERSFNSHWRDPWMVFQYDLDFDNADKRKTVDGKEDWDIGYKNIDPGSAWRGPRHFAGGVASRIGFEVGNGDAVPRGYLWAAGTAYTLSTVLDHAMDASKALSNSATGTGNGSGGGGGTGGGANAPKGEGGSTNWGGVAFTVASMGLQVWGMLEKEEHGGASDTEKAMFAASMIVSSMQLVSFANAGTAGGQTLGKVAAPLGLALSIWGAKEFFENSDSWDPGYEANAVATVVGLQLSSISTILILSGSAGPAGWIVGGAALVVQVAAMIITYLDGADNYWDVADFRITPWSLGVNGYVVLVGAKYREELSEPSRRFGGFDGTGPGSNHPMAEAQLVHSDGGADKFILASAEFIERDGGRWYAYQSLSRINRTKIYYCDHAPYESERAFPNGIRQRVDSDPNDYYLIKEPDGTWARFGVGVTKGVERQLTEHGDPFEVYWALPNSVHTFGGGSLISGDSVAIVRDPGLQISEVRHSRDPRWVRITRTANAEKVEEMNGSASIRSTEYRFQNHLFNGGRHDNVAVGKRPSAVPGLQIPVRMESVRMVSSIHQQVDAGRTLTTSFEYQDGNLLRTHYPDGSFADYSFAPAKDLSVFDGFCKSKVHWSGPDRRAKREWIYSYNGWGTEAGGGFTDEGGLPYLTTIVTTRLAYLDSLANGEPALTSRSDLYRYVLARDGVNVRHNPGVYHSQSLADTAITREMEYQTARMQLTTQILGSEGPGARTDFGYDGDLLIQKVERMGRDLTIHPTVTQYVYDRLGNVALEQVNSEATLRALERNFLLSFSDEFKAGTLDTSSTWDALRPQLIANYKAKTNKDYVGQYEVLDRLKLNAWLNQDSTEFWNRYGVWSRNPRRARDSTELPKDMVKARSRLSLELLAAAADSMAAAAHRKDPNNTPSPKNNLSEAQWREKMASLRREQHDELEKLVADSIRRQTEWKAMPESATVWYDTLRRATFQPFGRYVAGLPLGTVETRKHPDTSALESGVYGTRLVYDTTWLRPIAQLGIENGNTRVLQRWFYGATDRNPYAPTKTKTYFGPIGDNGSQLAYRYEEMDLDDRYSMQPKETRVWRELQWEDSAQGEVWNTPNGTTLVTTREFDPRMRLTKVTDPRGSTVEYSYDLADRLRRELFPNGATRRKGYSDVQDPAGWVWEHDTLESGVVVSYGFDGVGRFGREVRHSADGKDSSVSKYVYGIHDKLARQVDPDGRIVERDYDSFGRLAAVRVDKPGLGAYVRSYDWDDYHRVLTETDANGLATKFSYNLYGQDVKVERRIDDTSMYVAEYRFDNFGNAVWVKSPDGDTTGHLYDWGNRVRRSLYPEGLVVRNHYDWQGLLRTTASAGSSAGLGAFADLRSDSSVLSYDALGRKDSLWVVGEPRMGVRYLYDSDGDTTDLGMLLAVRQASGAQARYRYNSRGTMVRRIASQKSLGRAFSDTLAFFVRPDQSRSGLGLPGGARIEYGYNLFDRIGRVDFLDPSGHRHELVDSMRYRRSDLIDTIRFGNGVRRVYGYDSTRPLLTSMVALDRKDKEVSSMSLRYDDEGNIVEQVRPGGERAIFEYDGLYRLKAVRYPSGDRTARGNLRFGYTKNGNRTSFGHDFGAETWSYQPGTNLVLGASMSDGTRRYGWDYRGNLARETRWPKDPGALSGGAIPGDWVEDRQLQWNRRNELERFSQLRSGPSGQDTSLYGYGYDENGWRVHKAHGAIESDTSWKTVERTVWDGVNAVADSGVTDSGWSYHVHLGVNRVAEMRRTGAGTWKPTYILPDHLGTVQTLLDDTGAVRSRYQLDPYGNLESFEGDRSTAYLFTGKPRDAESGWDYFGARYYDPVRGMWNSRDPAGQFFSAYAYSRNPVAAIDPNGGLVFLAAIPIVWGAVEVGLSAWDMYETGKTLLDPNATNAEKGTMVAATGMGMITPGGGLAGAGKKVAKEVAEVGAREVAQAGERQAAKQAARHVDDAASKSMLGSKGAKIQSKTIWKGKGKERIDIENPNPGQRPGQIHYQDNAGGKYLYRPEVDAFENAPKAVNKLLSDPSFRAAIDKGMRFLGETKK